MPLNELLFQILDLISKAFDSQSDDAIQEVLRKNFQQLKSELTEVDERVVTKLEEIQAKATKAPPTEPVEGEEPDMEPTEPVEGEEGDLPVPQQSSPFKI